MKSPKNSGDETRVDIQFNLQQENVPLLLQPSYARSKSLLFDELRNFRISLKWCALDHSSCIGKFISYFAFIFLAIIVPLISSLCIKVPSSTQDCAQDGPVSFNKLVQFPESGLALVGFFILSRFFSKYGLRHLLFLDGLQEDSLFVRRGYTRELDKAFRYLACILLPSFFVELAHKIIYFSTVRVSFPGGGGDPWINSIVMFVLVLASWVYRTGRRSGSDAGFIFREHLRIRKQLSATSHRYRFFIIASLVVISISQMGALLLILGTHADKSFFSSGELVVINLCFCVQVCSAVELSGFFLCVLGAARITHRAQGITSVATRWHMTATCASVGGSDSGKGNAGEAADHDQCRDSTSSSSDSDSSSDINIKVLSSQEPPSFQIRQALVAYLQHNNGGITLFGFALDRGLLHTIFAFEFSLVLWILSKVVVLS
ncbi:ras guanine nucleotide exchange factor k [Citrus sinensis]|uniref:Ras guanine nucleotide exchange factor k n=1 Tax=Citrus sinensis TaxID=2711 RepID=A0ACB8NKN3_CITSI|nr:ras guanine nucleotide exchange factor k [Citrus sinensis]